MEDSVAAVAVRLYSKSCCNSSSSRRESSLLGAGYIFREWREDQINIFSRSQGWAGLGCSIVDLEKR